MDEQFSSSGPVEFVVDRTTRVLLTGASGFVGRQVVAPLLGQGCEVHLTCRSPRGLSSVHEHQVDLFDELGVLRLLEHVRPTHLVHLAWYTEPPAYWQSPVNNDWVRCSLHLIDSFARNGGERLVVVGTCAEYEWGSDMFKEGTTRENPATLYGRAKLSLLHLTEAIARENGISVAWARLFFLFGPFERKERLVPSIINPLLRTETAYCRNGDLERDFLYVEDAGEAISALMNSRVEGTVNVASGVAVQLGDIARWIGAAMQHLDLVKVDTEGVKSGQPKTIVADVTRLRREVGWTPRFGLHQGLERTIAWRASHRRLNAV